MSPTVTTRPVDDEAIPYVETLLARNDLPTADVRSKPGCFYVGYDGPDRVAVGGIEPCDEVGLLRSLAVEESARGQGYGTAMCDELAAIARDAGIETLYLLTTTAADFFADRGYVTVDRADVPPAIRETTEFADLCPETATCMRRSL